MIKIDDLIPLLKDGWVAMDRDGDWFWYEDKPEIIDEYDCWGGCGDNNISLKCFDIKPSFVYWIESLIEIKDGKRCEE